MKYLHESILSSTNTGMEGMIRGWWKNTDKADINISIVPHGDGMAVVMCDFEKSAYTSSFTFTQRIYDSMPEFLSGIFYTDYSRYNGKKEDSIRTCLLVLNNVKDIDLSQFDWRDMPLASLDTHVNLFCCSGKLTGLPQSTSKMNVAIRMSNFDKVSFKQPNVNISGSRGDRVCIEAFDRCVFDCIYVTMHELGDPARIHSVTNAELLPYHAEGLHYILNGYAASVIDKFYNKQNKCNKIYYLGQSRKDIGFLRKDMGKIILNKDKKWEIVKL